MTKYKGECFCGSVHVEVTGEPAVMAICHCKLCRSWSAAPVTGAALWEPENFKVSKGEEFLSSYAKVQGHDRRVRAIIRRQVAPRRVHELCVHLDRDDPLKVLG